MTGASYEGSQPVPTDERMWTTSEHVVRDPNARASPIIASAEESTTCRWEKQVLRSKVSPGAFWILSDKSQKYPFCFVSNHLFKDGVPVSSESFTPTTKMIRKGDFHCRYYIGTFEDVALVETILKYEFFNVDFDKERVRNESARLIVGHGDTTSDS